MREYAGYCIYKEYSVYLHFSLSLSGFLSRMLQLSDLHLNHTETLFDSDRKSKYISIDYFISSLNLGNLESKRRPSSSTFKSAFSSVLSLSDSTLLYNFLLLYALLLICFIGVV